MRTVISLATAFVLLGGIGTGLEQAEACSGGQPTIDYYLRDSDVVVKGEITESDAINQNGYIHVEEYLVGGTGPEILLISQLSPAAAQVWFDYGGGYASCGGFNSPIMKGQTGIYFLMRTEDGGYLVSSGEIYQFPTDASTVEIGYLNDDEVRIEGELNQAEFLNLIAEKSGETPALPDTGAPYPFQTALLVITENDSAYMIPVDGQAPILLGENVQDYLASNDLIGLFMDGTLHLMQRDWQQAWSEEGWPRIELELPVSHCKSFECVAFSPGGIYLGLINEKQQFSGCMYEQWEKYHEDDSCPVAFEGAAYAFAFSPDDRSIAVWQENSLQIYTLANPGEVSTIADFMPTKNTPLTTTSTKTITTIAGKGVWVNDGRTFAYSDAQGLWLWNALAENVEPQLVLPREADAPIAFPLYFSPLGHFLAIEEGDNLSTLDITTGERLPYGVVSPDDRKLVGLSINGGDTYSCDLILNECSKMWDRATDIIWISEREYLGFLCGEVMCEPVTAHVPFWDSQSRLHWDCEDYLNAGSEQDHPWFYGTDYDFNPLAEELVILNNTSTISIGYELVDWRDTSTYGDRSTTAACDNYITLDLSPYLDGDIKSAEWLPSLWYGE